MARCSSLLAERGITRLMVEAGPIVAAAFVHADLVDEAALFRAPACSDRTRIDALEGLPLDALVRSPRLVPTAARISAWICSNGLRAEDERFQSGGRSLPVDARGWW